MAAFFLLALGIGRKESKDEAVYNLWDESSTLTNQLHKAFKIRLRLFLENFVEFIKNYSRY